MAEQPTGTVTFLFTDIEGSTRRWQEHPEAMRAALEAHDSLLSDAIASRHGHTFKHTGDGFCAVFWSAAEGVEAAVAGQRALACRDWSEVGGLLVRMGIHTGEAEQRDGDYFGPALNRAARIMGIGHGGQILLSSATAGLLADDCPEQVELISLGEHRLRDLANVERVHQVRAPGLRSDFPPLRSLDGFENNLPVPRTSFVGRQADLAEVVDRLGEAALVTLAGIGGAGKTRLALEAATCVLDRFPDGVFFVDLGPVSDSSVVVSTVAAAVGLRRGGTGGTAQAPHEELLAHLTGRHLLIVLDNCEHLVEECADLVDRVLEACSDVTVLATSREPLSVPGEHVIRVGSLAVDDGESDDASRLFHDRAQAVDRSYDPEVHAGAVQDICRRLDGIPLAIELAAGQVGHLAPTEMLARLDDRFGLLTGGRRRVQRQQTLEAALDWSHDLLADDEKVLLRRLAVFAGPFAIAEAEAVAADEALPATRVVPVLARLVEKSMVVAGDDDGPMRYRLLETVRLYALQRLTESSEMAVVRNRHRDHFLSIVEAVPQHARLDDMESARRLWESVGNLRAALDWSLVQGRSDLVARQLAGSLGMYWIHGLVEEGLEWSTAALEADDLDPDVRAGVLVVLGISQMMQGDFASTAASFAAAADAASDPEVWALAQGWHGFSVMYDRQLALRLLDDLVDRARQADLAPHWEGWAHFFRGAVHLWHADFAAAIESFDQARSTTPPEPSSFTQAFVGVWQATALALLGRDEEARTRVDEVDAPAVAHTWPSYFPDLTRALIHAVGGRRALAVEALQNAVQSVRRHSVPLADHDCLLVCLALAWQHGEAERAGRLLGVLRGDGPVVILRAPSSYGIHLHHQRLVRGALPEDVSRRVYEEGKRVSADDALDAELARLASDPQA